MFTVGGRIGETWGMAFGQSAGSPASGRQVSELLELLARAGHADFRDARGPMGFTQRQAAGKFTAAEAAEFIEQLQEAEHAQGPTPAPAAKPAAKVSAAERALRQYSDHQLAAELQRRGWIVVEPPA